MRARFLKIILTSLAFIFLSNCKSTYNTQVFSVNKLPSQPNYELETSWAVLPTKYTKEFKKYTSSKPDTLRADVFYVYPTLNTSKKDNRWNVPVDDVEQNNKVLTKAVLFQSSAFAETGKVYVPFYRQAHYRSFVKGYKKEGKKALKLAYSDVKNAFEVYLKKYNNKRPIILVGHSQGAKHSIQLIKDFFDKKPLAEKLIAAYIPGIRVKPNEFKSIKPMSSPNETGGFVTWNTFKKGNTPKNKKWYTGSVTTNPITWDSKMTTELQQHKGFLYSNGKMYSQALKVQITDGLVWSTNPKFPLRFFMSFLKNYHAGDINLFWLDIKENSLLRTQNWVDKNIK